VVVVVVVVSSGGGCITISVIKPVYVVLTMFDGHSHVPVPPHA